MRCRRRARSTRMRAIFELRAFAAAEPQPRFVNKRGRLERVTGGFMGHLVRGEFAQLLIDERQ